MYIARRTGGGRGVYEIAGQTEKGYTATRFVDHELVVILPDGKNKTLGLILKIQGGKPRISRRNNTGLQIQRQLAALLLMPKPIRANTKLGSDDKILKTNEYAIEHINLSKINSSNSILYFEIETIQIQNNIKQEEIFFANRLSKINNLKNYLHVFPESIQNLLSQYFELINVVENVNFEAEKLINQIQFACQTLDNKRENIPYVYDPLDVLTEFLDSQDVKKVEEVTYAEEDNIHPEEIREPDILFEGAKRVIQVNSYERNSKARKQCIDFYGINCKVCGISFENVYGEIGKDFIHVHHIKLISKITEIYQVDPVADLIPVCPNCHAMLHKKEPPYTIEELSAIIENQSSKKTESHNNIFI